MRPEDIRILIVDDEPDLLKIFPAWLRLAGFTDVRTAANGIEAMTVLRAESIDVLVSDVRMPVMDGITLVRQLTELHISVPAIIFVSGFGDIDVREMYGMGVEAFLAKPINREQLVMRLEKAASARADLWLAPLVSMPRQTIDCPVDSGAHSDHANRLALGHGGFSITNAEPLSLSKTSFRCSFDDTSGDGKHRPILSGHGYVRWYSRGARMAGIEFVYLDPSCRAWVCEEIAATRPRSFIPSDPTGSPSPRSPYASISAAQPSIAPSSAPNPSFQALSS